MEKKNDYYNIVYNAIFSPSSENEIDWSQIVKDNHKIQEAFIKVFNNNLKDKSIINEHQILSFIIKFESYLKYENKIDTLTIKSWKNDIRKFIFKILEKNDNKNILSNIKKIDEIFDKYETFNIVVKNIKVKGSENDIDKEWEEFDLTTNSTYSTTFNGDIDLQKRNSFSNTTLFIHHSIVIYSVNDPTYNEEEEVIGENLIYKPSSQSIQFISTNLLIKKILYDNFMKTQSDLMNGFIEQFTSFYKCDILVQKVINAYKFYSLKEQPHNLKRIIKFLNHIILEIYSVFNNIECIANIYKDVIDFYNEIYKNPIFQNLFTTEVKFLLTAQSHSPFDIEFSKNFIKKRNKRKKVNIKLLHNSVNIHNKSSLKKNYFDILDYDPIEIALQLTYLTKIDLMVIKPREVIGGRFNKKDKLITSPAISKIIKRSGDLTNFIIEDILSYDISNIRAKVIEKWIKVEDECIKLNNFNDSQSIDWAIGNFIIKKLEKTWKLVKSDSINLMKKNKEIFSFEGNSKRLREEIKNCKGKPYIPFLGLLLRDIAHFEEKFHYIKDNKLINFEKIENIHNVLDSFFSFKEGAYNFDGVNKNLLFFQCLVTSTESELEALGDRLEPEFILYKRKEREKRHTKIDNIFFAVKFGIACLGEIEEKEFSFMKARTLTTRTTYIK